MRVLVCFLSEYVSVCTCPGGGAIGVICHSQPVLFHFFPKCLLARLVLSGMLHKKLNWEKVFLVLFVFICLIFESKVLLCSPGWP